MKFWTILLSLLMVTSFLKAEPNDIVKEGLTLEISQKSIDTIIYYEVGGKAYYEKYLSRPTVPAWQTTASGVTIGMGFDLGYNSRDEIRSALTGVLSEADIILLQGVSGMKGKNAYYNGLPQVKYRIAMNYDQAMEVFMRDSLKRFSKQTSNAFQLTPVRLHPHSNGALISLVYNRGPSLSSSDSRKEMRWIKYNISTNKEYLVPSDIRSMKRLWSATALRGLHLRRDSEAKLFQEGLDEIKKLQL